MVMEKAYDFKALVAKVKETFLKQGVNLAEDVLEQIAKDQYFAIKGWLVESAALTATPFDDAAFAVLATFDKQIEDIKIDLNKDGI